MKYALRALSLFGTVAALALPAVPGHASTADQILVSDGKVDAASLPCSGTATARWDRSENVLEVNSALTRRDEMAGCEAKVTVNWLFNQRVVASVDRPLPAVRACEDGEVCDATVYDVWRKKVGAPDNTVPDSVKTQAEDISVQLTIEPRDSAEDPAEDPAEDADAAKGSAEDADAAENANAGKDSAENAAHETGDMSGEMSGEMAGEMSGEMAGYEQTARPGSEGGSEGYAQEAAKPAKHGASEGYADPARIRDLEGIERTEGLGKLQGTEIADCESVPPGLLGDISGTLAWGSGLNS